MKDPMIFVPSECVAYLKKNIEQEIGINLFYWLGKIQGWMGTKLLTKKYGFQAKDFEKLLDGASLDGWGKPILNSELDLKNLNARMEVTIKNPTIALANQGNDEHQDNFCEDYVTGELAGGGEVLFNKNITGTEIRCIAKGDDKCLLKFWPVEKEEFPLEDFDLQKYLSTIELLMFNRNYPFKWISKREIEYSEGQFKFKGIQGVLILSYIYVLMDYIMYTKKSEFYKELQKDNARQHLEKVKKNLKKGVQTTSKLEENLSHIEIFGFGKYEIKHVLKSGLYIIENKNNPYTDDFIKIFGTQNFGHYFIQFLLEEFFSYIIDKRVEVSEKECKLTGGKSCIFHVKTR
ncbi:MAG: hypothetical protein ACOCQX_03905 [Candidatus Nanoarchaeia archaeon]